MEKLPDSLLLQILSQLDDSAEVARCRVASKAFNTVFPGLRSINLLYSLKWSREPLQTVLLDIISKLETVESVGIISVKGIRTDDFSLTDVDFIKEWLPRVSGSLKSLSIIDRDSIYTSNVLSLISAYCHNLVNLNMESTCLSMDKMSPMPMLTSLRLDNVFLEDKHLDELNKCCPNLRVLNFGDVKGLENPKIHLLNLKTCIWGEYDSLPSITLITPKLVTLVIECYNPTSIHIEAPMLSYFRLDDITHAGTFTFTFKSFENLKTLWLESSHIGSLLSEFPITKSIETLTLDSKDVDVDSEDEDSEDEAPRDHPNSEFTLGKVFRVFPNVTSLCIYFGAWLELQVWMNPQGWEFLDESKGLKTFCAYVTLADLSFTFTSVACVLDQCVGLSEVSLLIHSDVECTVFTDFVYKCMARWRGLKWRWGIWSEAMGDTWITNVISS